MRRVGPILIALLSLGATRSARAQSPSADAAALFEQGREALAAKDYTTACPKLEASLALERAVGTLISLARCEEETKKLASARQHWKEAADFAVATHDRLDRAPFALKHFSEVDARVPRITVELVGPALPGTVVSRDGVPLPSSALGAALPVDAGPHTISVSASGHRSTSIKVDLAEGERRTVRVAPGPTEGAPPPALVAKPSVTGETPPRVDERGGANGQRTVAIIVGGVGVVALGVGAVTGLLASSRWSDAKNECGAGCGADSPSRAKADDATTLAGISSAGFIVGGVGVVAAAVLYLTAPQPRATSLRVVPGLGPHGGFVTAERRF